MSRGDFVTLEVITYLQAKVEDYWKAHRNPNYSSHYYEANAAEGELRLALESLTKNKKMEKGNGN